MARSGEPVRQARRGLTEHVSGWRLGVIIAMVWALLVLRLWGEHPWAIPGYLATAGVAVVLAEIDQRTLLLPNRLTYPAFGVVLVFLGAAAVVEGEPVRMVGALSAAGVGALVFLLLAWFGGMGMGDVKFVISLAASLGWLSWSAVLVGAAAAFLLSGIAGAVAIAMLGRERKTPIAFGPWLALGALVGVLTS